MKQRRQRAKKTMREVAEALGVSLAFVMIHEQVTSRGPARAVLRAAWLDYLKTGRTR
jgi:transcriptional regulator with XRE-family HTH domain